MAFWWVNQNKTSKYEIPEGYMWSPKHSGSKTGKKIYNQFYENMRLVEVGDLVFSFYEKHIQKVGIVQHTAISGDKPSAFGSTGDYWDNVGWFVPVEWHTVPNPVQPKNFLEEIRPHLPEKYSPINPHTGKGCEVYLAAVPENMAKLLLLKIGLSATELLDMSNYYDSDYGSIQKIEGELEKAIRNNTEIDETDKLALIKARKGQGRFRANVATVEFQCRLTGVTDPRLLRASHIKPWRSCVNNHERLDGYNGLLLAPHIDHLFDRGYISFNDNGDILLSSRINNEQYLLLGINNDPTNNVGVFHSEQLIYLKYHRENVFFT